RPRLAADATPTETSAAVSAMPKILVSRFIPHHLPTGWERGTELAPRSLSTGTETPCLRNDDRDAGDEARVGRARGGDVRRGSRRQRAAHLRADRCASGAGQLDLVRLALASRRNRGEVHLADGVAGNRRAVCRRVGGVDAGAAGRHDGAAGPEARARQAERGGEAVHAGEDDGGHNRGENDLCRPRAVTDLAHVIAPLVSYVPAGPFVRRPEHRREGYEFRCPGGMCFVL